MEGEPLMSESTRPVRDFLLQVDKTLKTRRMYSPHMAPYLDANETLFEKFQLAAGDEGFALRIGANDLFVDKISVLNRDTREESFFFPLYRDGLREIKFLPNTSVEEIEHLLRTFEAESKGLIGPSQDTVSYLWRGDLQAIMFKAIDGIGTEEGGDPTNSGDEFGALVSELMSSIQDPTPAEGEQSYSFVMDADLQVAATDLHYEASTARKAFDENPTVLRLDPRELETLQTMVAADDEENILRRFMEILFSILMDPAETITGDNLVPVFERLLQGFWQATDYSDTRALLERLKTAAQSAPRPATRETAGSILEEFLTTERVEASFEALETGAIDPADAEAIWNLTIDEAWEPLLEFHLRIPEDARRRRVRTFLCTTSTSRPELLRSMLTEGEPEQVQTALAVLDESLESAFASEVLALANHPLEAVRQKSVAIAGRLQTPEALDVLWNAMEHDPARPVRLLAFRVMPTANFPNLTERLETLITAADFASRPLWERQKYVRLFSLVGGDLALRLFDSWIPSRHWFWRKKDFEQAELAFHGLAARGVEGLQQVKAIAMQQPKLVPIAKKLLTAAVQATDR